MLKTWFYFLGLFFLASCNVSDDYGTTNNQSTPLDRKQTNNKRQTNNNKKGENNSTSTNTRTTRDCSTSECNTGKCIAHGFDGGNLKCGAQCEVITDDCYSCGDNLVNPGEICDGSSFGDKTCESELGLGWTGELSCSHCQVVGTKSCHRRFKEINANYFHTCAITTEDEVVCWGKNDKQQSDSPPGKYKSIRLGGNHNCALKLNGRAYCWGDLTYSNEFNPENILKMPTGTLDSFDSGYIHNCGIQPDHTVVCWGDSHYGQSTPPKGNFVQISTRYLSTCGLRKNGVAECWGINDGGEREVPPNTLFTQISSGSRHSCGLEKTTKKVICWGENRGGYIPKGKFKYVDAGYYFGCAIKDDDTLLCWNFKTGKEVHKTPGKFTAISVGFQHGCGIRTDHSSICWGGNKYGELNVP